MGEADGVGASPLGLRGWRDLYFAPRRFFARRHELIRRSETAFVGYVAGVAGVIDRIDTQLIRSDVDGGGSIAADVATSWLGFWMAVLSAGILSGYLRWFIMGWWYRKRLEWSGAVAPDRELARGVYMWQNLVVAAPSILYCVAGTFLYASYAEMWRTQTYAALFILVFIAWSCVTSYFAATTAFDHVSRARAALWFLALPLVTYTIALGALGLIFTMSG